METNEVSKSNKIKIIVITALIFLVSIAGISYAYFTIQITGNETASSMRLRTANMSLVYNDVQIVSGEYIEPGWTQTKTLTVTNNGNVDAYYTIIWRDLINEVWNGELVISATCSSSSGSCENISETSVPRKVNEEHNIRVKSNISIAPGVTHTYTLTALFKETGSNQNYNQNKYFNGTINIMDGEEPLTIVRNGTDSISGLPVVRIGSEDFYDITNAIDYSTLVSTNGNIYNFASGKSVLFAKNNLYVGRIYYPSDSTYTEISSSDSGYGLQSANAKGYSTNPAVGVVPFAGSASAYGYWNDQDQYQASSSSINVKYGSATANNIYDSNYVTAPNWNYAFSNNAGNADYSIAYYVEEYLDRLGINGVTRLLTYTEFNSFTQTQRANISGGAYYWLSSGNPNSNGVYFVYTDSNAASNNFKSQVAAGVRPVIIISTSDIQSS